eukprot:s721_g10.t1
MVSAGHGYTVLLRSDGHAVHIGNYDQYGQRNIPALDEGMTYTQISAGGYYHTVLLRSDGSAVAIGNNEYGQCNIPALDEGIAYTQISAGIFHTVLLRSDGSAVAIGNNEAGKCNIPPLDEGMAYTQISAGYGYTVLVRSDGCAVAIGGNGNGQCNIPPLDKGMAYTQTSAGRAHTVLLRSDGSAVAIGVMAVLLPSEEMHLENATSQLWMRVWHTPKFLQGTVIQCFSGAMALLLPLEVIGMHPIASLGPGIRYIGDTTRCSDLILQLELVWKEDTVTLICSTLGGEERCRLIGQDDDSAWEMHKRVARELNVNLQNLRLILPDAKLLAKVCRTNPGVSIAAVAQTQSTKRRRVT